VSTFHVENFGCRATQADGAAIERQFEERGLRRSAAEKADIVVLNTCTVTASADQDARIAIRRIHRQNPQSRIVVTGCYAQRAPQELASLPGVAQVVGNSHKQRLADIALNAEFSGARPSSGFVPLSALEPGSSDAGEGSIFVSDIFAHAELLPAPVFDAANERTRPNLKVQDGCDNRCSFCVIPYVRGQSRSLRLEEVVAQVNTLVEQGYREVVVSGINLGRWGRDLGRAVLSSQLPVVGSQFSVPSSELRVPSSQLAVLRENSAATENRGRRTEHSLEGLIRSILEGTSLEKLRISSVEPMDWTDALIRLVAESPRIAKHAHVPMQSGSDRILRAMHRKYRPWHYREKVEKIRVAMPTAAIGADVMVGFPGETDSDFEETRRIIADLPFTYLHVFTYSPRPGTPAACLRNQLPVSIARERNRILRELASKKKRDFMRSFVGREVGAITLRAFEDGYTEALTDNYLKLRLAGRHGANRWIRVRIEQVVEDGMLLGSAPAR
jgi:threonylcarbamoyladenosine tRNA methylthiotransferase MtaB